MGLLGQVVSTNERAALKYGRSIGLARFEAVEVAAAWSEHYAGLGRPVDWAMVQRAMIYRLDGITWRPTQ